MNFSEFSEINNTELGVLLSSLNDKEAFEDAIVHCKDIVSEATLEYPTQPKSNAVKEIPIQHTQKIVTEKKEKIFETKKSKQLGYCIRTGKKIPLNHAKPFCTEAYESWAEWGDESYEEKFDHFTGEKSNGDTCKATPILKKNWKNYQKTVE